MVFKVHEQMTIHQYCDGRLLKMLFASGYAWLEHHQEQINAMNVFPVPDGDTGTNMRLTLKKAYESIAHMEDAHAGKVALAFAQGALLGARGNSGVILSQLLRGFADAVAGQGRIDTALFATAAQSAVDRAYQTVEEPVEGTILTVARFAAEAVRDHAEASDNLCAALDAAIDAARETLHRTPELLPVLKQSGVLDSGGQGLVYMLEGMSRSVNGLPVLIADDDHQPLDSALRWDDDFHLEAEDGEDYGYDVQFLMYGHAMDVAQVRADLNAMGWSTLVVGDETLIKVHIHVHDPGEPISYGIAQSDALDDVVVENMQRQYEARKDSGPARLKIQQVAGVAVIAVAAGDGLNHVFYESQAACVVSGGQTMNPSTDDFLQAIQAVDNDAVILLPNNKNILLAARQAAEQAQGKQVAVVPTASVPQGISAMLAYMDLAGETDLDVVQAAMDDARQHVTTGEITTATRDAHLDAVDVQQGAFIGLLDDDLVVTAADITTAVRALLDHADMDAYELITLYAGSEVDQDAAEAMQADLQAEYPDHRLLVIDGGQPLYPYLISLE
jgi:uncharacterized protein